MESDLNAIPTVANRSVICTSHLDRSSVSSRNSRRTPHLIAPTSRPQALLSPASRLLGPPPTFTSRASMSVPPFHTQASPPRLLVDPRISDPPKRRAEPTVSWPTKAFCFWDFARLSFPDAQGKWSNSGQPTIRSRPHPRFSMPSRTRTNRWFVWIIYITAAPSGCVAIPRFTVPSSNPCIPQDVEYDHDFSPAWRYVITPMHWAKRPEAIGELCLRSAFGLQPDRPILSVSYHQVYFACGNTSD